VHSECLRHLSKVLPLQEHNHIILENRHSIPDYNLDLSPDVSHRQLNPGCRVDNATNITNDMPNGMQHKPHPNTPTLSSTLKSPEHYSHKEASATKFPSIHPRHITRTREGAGLNSPETSLAEYYHKQHLQPYVHLRCRLCSLWLLALSSADLTTRCRTRNSRYPRIPYVDTPPPPMPTCVYTFLPGRRAVANGGARRPSSRQQQQRGVSTMIIAQCIEGYTAAAPNGP
jgi:hypothetical protein